MHETKDASEILKSKAKFEAFAAKHNVQICNIHADNEAYASQAFNRWHVMITNKDLPSVQLVAIVGRMA